MLGYISFCSDYQFILIIFYIFNRSIFHKFIFRYWDIFYSILFHFLYVFLFYSLSRSNFQTVFNFNFFRCDLEFRQSIYYLFQYSSILSYYYLYGNFQVKPFRNSYSTGSRQVKSCWRHKHCSNILIDYMRISWFSGSCSSEKFHSCLFLSFYLVFFLHLLIGSYYRT